MVECDKEKEHEENNMSFEWKRNLGMLAVFLVGIFLGFKAIRIYFYGLMICFVLIFIYMVFRSSSRSEEEESFEAILRLLMIYIGLYVSAGVIALIFR